MKSLKKISHLLLGALLAMVIGLGAFTAQPALATTPNFTVAAAPGVVVIPLHISGQYTATTPNVARFQMPFRCRLIGVTVSARASGGTAPTLTVDLFDDTVSALSAPISVTAGTYGLGTITNPLVLDESVMTVDLTITGTTPTWNDITILITVVRE